MSRNSQADLKVNISNIYTMDLPGHRSAFGTGGVPALPKRPAYCKLLLHS